jgi:hypothetical protein
MSLILQSDLGELLLHIICEACHVARSIYSETPHFILILVGGGGGIAVDFKQETEENLKWRKFNVEIIDFS